MLAVNNTKVQSLSLTLMSSDNFPSPPLLPSPLRLEQVAQGHPSQEREQLPLSRIKQKSLWKKGPSSQWQNRHRKRILKNHSNQ